MDAEAQQALPSRLGKRGRVKMPPKGDVYEFMVVDEIRHIQEGSEGEKLLVLQKLEFEDSKEHIEIRFCYYIKGKKEGMKGRWVFGQFAPITRIKDFQAIYQKAVDKGWFA